MTANFSSVLSWVSTEAANAPEPLVLLVLGALFIALSFRVRVRRNEPTAEPTVPVAPRPAVPTAPAARARVATTRGALAHEAR